MSSDSHTHYGKVDYNPDGISGLRRELHNEVGELRGEVREKLRSTPAYLRARFDTVFYIFEPIGPFKAPRPLDSPESVRNPTQIWIKFTLLSDVSWIQTPNNSDINSPTV